LNRKTGEKVVSYQDACERVMEALRGASPVLASQIADAIWPNHHMKRQGAALAASRFADRMKTDGILRYVVREHTRGWVLTNS